MELICPAGTPAAYRDAVEAGADSIYCGFRNETNARNFPGLNFSPDELGEAIAHGARSGVMTLVAINTFMRAGAEEIWTRAVDDAVALGAHALISPTSACSPTRRSAIRSSASICRCRRRQAMRSTSISSSAPSASGAPCCRAS